jgi:hypothetical protein
MVLVQSRNFTEPNTKAMVGAIRRTYTSYGCSTDQEIWDSLKFPTPQGEYRLLSSFNPGYPQPLFTKALRKTRPDVFQVIYDSGVQAGVTAHNAILEYKADLNRKYGLK